ncbi:hypothetical protein SPHFLASMR4Y_03213 [Sphingorhabdus sp. SMR4y]|nr:hypothetical protein SPHFLASMR4Y_03213 [Sphingorhabdus sp. SMR4y]
MIRKEMVENPVQGARVLGMSCLTVARGKSSRLVLLAGTLRPSDSHEATKPQSDYSPSPVREKDTKPCRRSLGEGG